jgi:hypothetical protein
MIVFMFPNKGKDNKGSKLVAPEAWRSIIIIQKNTLVRQRGVSVVLQFGNRLTTYI